MDCWLVYIRAAAHGCAEWTQWSSPAELLEADAVLLSDETGCGLGCEHSHIFAWADELGRTHIRRSVHDRTAPPLEEELRECYPREVEHTDECWPPPPRELNPPLVKRPLVRSALGEKIDRGRAATLAQAVPVPQ
jgi:hypothetical protein